MRTRDGSAGYRDRVEVARLVLALIAVTGATASLLACGDARDSMSSSSPFNTESTTNGGTGEESTSTSSIPGEAVTESEATTGPSASSSTGDIDLDPEAACAAHCRNDVECDPEAEWTEEECFGYCVRDSRDGPCSDEYVALWTCIGELSCEEYLEWAYGGPLDRYPCRDKETEIDACERKNSGEGK